MLYILYTIYASTSWLVNFLKLSNRSCWGVWGNLKKIISLDCFWQRHWTKTFLGRWTSTRRRETSTRRVSTCSQLRRLSNWGERSSRSQQSLLWWEITGLWKVFWLIFHFFEGATSVWEAGVSLQGQTCRFYKVGLLASLLKYFFPDYSKEPYVRNPAYIAMRKRVIDKYRKNKKSKSLIPTFR